MNDKPLEQILNEFRASISKKSSGIVIFNSQEIYEEELDVLLSIARDICSAFAYSFFQGKSCTIKDRRITALRINWTNLTAIPQQINKLTCLTHLELNYNRISTIDPLYLPKLESLELYRNKIRKIENMNNLPSLKKLYLKDNLIVKIENLDNLPELQSLYLSKNRIRKIENLDNLTRLKELSLKNNWISIVENLDNLHQLEDIWLKYNLIKSDDPGLQKLKTKGVKVYA